MDDFSCHYLGELYALDIAQLGEHIQAMQPEASALEVTRRATLIASMIEGLMVTMGSQEKRELAREDILEGAFDVAMAIALG